MGSKIVVAKAKLTSNEKEAANRAEVTALLIRVGFRVYRPEADCYGEDLIVRTPDADLRAVQLKATPDVNWKKYGGKSLWMLFPDPKSAGPRKWFLVPHDKLYKWAESEHGQAPKWKKAWHWPCIPRKLGKFLNPFEIKGSRRPGALRGKLRVGSKFFEPLPPKELSAWGR